MLKVRLQRIGRKNDPSFRVVLTDSKNSTKSGKFLEILGNFPKKGQKIQFENCLFTIEVVDKKRVKQIKVTLD